MGLRKGMAILLYYAVGGSQYQAVLIAQDSALGKAKKSKHRLAGREYVAFTEPHMQLAGKAFEAGVVVEDIYYLWDTRSADDLAVFTQMAPERLCLGCGLRVDEPFAPLTAGERPELFAAACKLLPSSCVM